MIHGVFCSVRQLHPLVVVKQMIYDIYSTTIITPDYFIALHMTVGHCPPIINNIISFNNIIITNIYSFLYVEVP